MKFFTKEWFDLSKHSHIDLLMCVTKPAETFSEEYYQNLLILLNITGVFR